MSRECPSCGADDGVSKCADDYCPMGVGPLDRASAEAHAEAMARPQEHAGKCTGYDGGPCVDGAEGVRRCYALGAF